MSFSRREKLADDIMDRQPQLRDFLRDRPHGQSMMTGSWDLTSYSFQRGFETLWDHAVTDGSGLLLRPLLLLWRQSLELALKAAIVEIAGDVHDNPGHNLVALFAQVIELMAREGFVTDDDLTLSVNKMVELAQSVDPFADRFRYPTKRGGQPFNHFEVDLDQLFQAHWVVVTYCEGSVLEIERKDEGYALSKTQMD